MSRQNVKARKRLDRERFNRSVTRELAHCLRRSPTYGISPTQRAYDAYGRDFGVFVAENARQQFVALGLPAHITIAPASNEQEGFR